MTTETLARTFGRIEDCEAIVGDTMVKLRGIVEHLPDPVSNDLREVMHGLIDEAEGALALLPSPPESPTTTPDCAQGARAAAL